MMKKYLPVLLLIVFTGACKKKALDVRQFIAWVENKENGLKVTQQMGDFTFSLQYKPLEYIVLMEKRKESVKKEEIEQRRKELEGLQYYTLKIENKNGEEIMKAGIKNDNEYYVRLEYFISQMQDDLALIEGQDTLSCTLYHFERTYNIAPYNTFVIGFGKAKAVGKGEVNKMLIYTDRVLGTGPVKFMVKGEDIDKLPALELN